MTTFEHPLNYLQNTHFVDTTQGSVSYIHCVLRTIVPKDKVNLYLDVLVSILQTNKIRKK